MSTKKPIKDYVFVIIQLLLFLVYFIPNHLLPAISLPGWASYLGLALAILAVIFGILALLQLSSSLSPYPTPLDTGKLVTHGVFRISRHPIYTSIIFAGFGYAIYEASLYKVLVTVLLVILFYFKSK